MNFETSVHKREAQQIHFRPYHNELKLFYHKVFPHRLAGRFGISHFTAKMSTSEPCDFDYNFESSSTSHRRMYSLGSANSIPIQLETSPFLFVYIYIFKWNMSTAAVADSTLLPRSSPLRASKKLNRRGKYFFHFAIIIFHFCSSTTRQSS